MLRKCAALLVFLTLSATVWAQGLNVPQGVTKDDWEEINFEFNSSVLVDGFPSLLRLAELLQKNTGDKVRVEGHTDVIGSSPYNDRLGLARANAVRDFLVKYGAAAGQITATSEGKANPRYPGQKNTFTPTDEARYMNRRVSLTVTDAQGKTVSAAGSAGDAIRAIEPAAGVADCCSEVLKRLDKLDDIAKMLKDLADQNADLKKQLGDLKNAQQVLESKVNQPAPPPAAVIPPPTAEEVGKEVAKQIDARKDPRFQLLGVNIGADDTGNTTFSGKGRFFAPMGERFGFQADAEYLYFKNQREGQFDFGLVDRLTPHFQVGLFGSFKHVTLTQYQNGGTLGQAAFTADYIFKGGKLGFFGTKGFMDDSLINSVHATDPISGALLNHIFLNSYLMIVDQAGVSTTLALWKNNYLEGNIAYLHAPQEGNRFGGTARFIFPLNNKLAVTVEGGMNETLVGPGNSGRAVVGLQFSNMLRPKEFLAVNHALPVDVPRIRYEVVTKKVRNGNDPPIADAGPDQINVPAGIITLDGSKSYDPDGDALTYQWVQEVGPAVTLSAPTASKTTYTAVQGQRYTFRLTVTDTFGAQASARTTDTTQTAAPVQILFFTADPKTITTGQSSTLSWGTLNATNVTISSIGPVPVNGNNPVSPTQTTTYVLTASNAVNTVTATATVVVNPIQTKLQYCYATPTNIMAGESATLNWATVNADSVNIAPGVGAVAKSGNVAVTPTATTNYTITATGAGGASTDTCNLTVTVTPGQLPRIIRFSGIPPTISSGQTSTLLWVVENADTVTINQGVGNVSIDGTQDVTPAATTVYTITATNKVGSVQATATINVNVVPPPKVLSFTANPNPSPAPGTRVTLQCNTSGASTVTMANILFLPPNPTFVVFPTVTTTYTCIATSAGGLTDTASVTVTVNTPPTPPTGNPPTITVSGGLSQTTIYREITLDASATSSPSGNNPLTYSWTQASGVPSAIGGASSPIANIEMGNETGEYDFLLTVTDSKGNVATALVKITLLNTRTP
jgi:hypothetical protein